MRSARPLLASLEGVEFHLLGLAGRPYTKAKDLAERMGRVLAREVMGGNL